MKYIHKTYTLFTRWRGGLLLIKSYLRQAVWGRYIRELIHFKTTLQGKFKRFTTEGKEVT